MLEEVLTDKARIAREAGVEWAEGSALFADLVSDPDEPWFEPGDTAVEWLTPRRDKVLGMTEAELRRAVKRYLNSWAQALLRKRRAIEKEEAHPLALEWDGMMDDLRDAERVARGKAGKKNLTPWRAPRGYTTVEGETIDYTSHEFWSDLYLYAIANPRREGESRTAFIRRMGDAGANEKARAERMPQPHNGTRRHYSINAAHSDALVASMDGEFDEDLQTVLRPTLANRRPMDLREEDWVQDRPVTRGWLGAREMLAHRIKAGKFAKEPLQV